MKANKINSKGDAAMGWALSIDKADITRAMIVETPSRALADGEARLTVRRFALTANNITYAVFGEIMAYWAFFPADDGGRLPVWGFADVTESKADGIETGERIYGYFPAGDELIVKPGQITKGSFVDETAHRSGLPEAYNRYRRCANDPGYAPEREHFQQALQPLFLTSWLIDLHLRETGFAGAHQASLTSASSKTALALAWCIGADRPDGVTIEAITSARSKPFVETTGFYDSITLYDDLKDLQPAPKRIVIDFAGDSTINAAIHGALGDDLAANIRVGAAHWEQSAPASDLPGPKPAFFFAPDHAVKRMKEWGNSEFLRRYTAAWAGFSEAAHGLFDTVEMGGADGALGAYKQLVGNAAPASAAISVEVS
ncbi:MAG: DUF2855 family protein [Alphaproteobacteria bacterium]|nr:DUF2855 family protein [Alphaproteobacteria bacterium]